MAAGYLRAFCGFIGQLCGRVSAELAVYEGGNDRHAAEAVSTDGYDRAVSEYLLSAGLRGDGYTVPAD